MTIPSRFIHSLVLVNNLRRLPKLLVFTTVARLGSFTRAADALEVSKSAVSQQISLLEKELGVSLINRTTRGISLTSVGSLISAHCESLQDQVETIFEDIDDALKNPRGRFTVTFPHSLESIVVVPAMEQLCREFPNLEPHLIASDKTLDLIDHNIDISVHAGELPDSSYRALPIGTITEIFCATPTFLEDISPINELCDLEQQPWIATSWQSKNMSLFHAETHQCQKVLLNEFARVNTLPTALHMTKFNMGIALLPDLVVKDLIKSGMLNHVFQHMVGPRWPIYAVHAYQNKKPIHATRFYQLICDHFRRV